MFSQFLTHKFDTLGFPPGPARPGAGQALPSPDPARAWPSAPGTGHARPGPGPAPARPGSRPEPGARTPSAGGPKMPRTTFYYVAHRKYALEVVKSEGFTLTLVAPRTLVQGVQLLG